MEILIVILRWIVCMCVETV